MSKLENEIFAVLRKRIVFFAAMFTAVDVASLARAVLSVSRNEHHELNTQFSHFIESLVYCTSSQQLGSQDTSRSELWSELLASLVSSTSCQQCAFTLYTLAHAPRLLDVLEEHAVDLHFLHVNDYIAND